MALVELKWAEIILIVIQSAICGLKKYSAKELAIVSDAELPPLSPHIIHNYSTNHLANPANNTKAYQPPSSTKHNGDQMFPLSPSPSPYLAVTNTCLYDQLSEALIKEEQSPRPFLPRGAFDKLITAESIEVELLRTGCITTTQSRTEVQGLVDFILSRAKKCFATLVFIKRVPEIKTFHQNSLTDEQLPVAFEFVEGKCIPSVLDKARSHPDVELLSTCFQHPWDRQDREAFAEKQWLFLVPVFTEENWQHKFHDKCPLPFLYPVEQVARQTLFSEVRQWLIHRDHIAGVSRPEYGSQNFKLTWWKFGRQLDEPDQVVADKELKLVTDNGNLSSPDPEFEATTLERTRKLNHRHLIKAIAVYKQRGQHHFIFPWAQYGNLREYWVEWQGLQKAHWALKQIDGLCDALREFHAQNWRHGDLKPENILCFADGQVSGGCVMVIGDVGLAKAHTVVTQHRRGKTGTMTGTWMYGPPEEKGLPRSRLYDIWSMGAIVLEMIICLLYGHDEVSRLHNYIQKFYIDQTDGNTIVAHVHPEVQRWIAHMYQDPRCGNRHKPTAILYLLKLVEDRLLVVKLPQGTERTDELEQPIQLDIPQLTVQAPQEMQQDARILIDTPRVEVGTEGGPLSSVRADAIELHDKVHSIWQATDSKQLPLFVNSDQTFHGPPAQRKQTYGDTLAIPGQPPAVNVGEATMLQPSLGPQPLEMNSQVSYIPGFHSFDSDEGIISIL